MKRLLLLSLLLLNSLISFSQELINSTPVALKKDRAVFQIVNNDKKEVTLFLSDKAKVKGVQLNEQMKITDSISIERPNPKIYSNMIGYNTNTNGSTRLFWSSNDFEDIFTQLYDFTNRKVETQQHTIVFKDEKILQKFSRNEKFHILTVVKKTNTFKFHVFDKDGKLEQKTIDLSNFHFYTSKYTKTTLYGMFDMNLLPFEAPFTLQYINALNPTSLTDTAKKRKCYLNDNQLIITFDNNPDYTQVVIIDLENFTAIEKIIKKPAIAKLEFSIINSNSFYFENKLYLIKSSADLLYFSIKDLDDNIIKEYSANNAKPINFKNSEISQENSGGGKRVLENTSQFIRKINNLNSGLTCYHIGEATLIAIGGVSEVQQSTGQAVLGQFGLIGSLVSVVAFNPTMESFNSYSNRKVVKIEGIFDKEGNHIEGNLQPLAFDKIRTFFDKNNDVSSQTLFRMSNFYYLGYYDIQKKEYSIRKFAD